MMMQHARQLCRIPIRRYSEASLSRVSNTQSPHIYMKTYTKDELVKYFLDNVVYSSSDHIVSCVPQGVKFLNTDVWHDSETNIICETPLLEMMPELCDAFRIKTCFLTKYPRRNASGLTIFSTNHNAFTSLRKHFLRQMKSLTRTYIYLAVVVGSLPVEISKTFRLERGYEENNCRVEILEEFQFDSRKTMKIRYNHTVEDESDDISLVKISVSSDLRDCVRHILAQRFFTPVLGDFWSAKRTRNFLFGAPIGSIKEGPYELKSHILEKLQLHADEQKYIPIHAHLYGLKMSLSNCSEFFVSVPPPESFLWTCKQLGLHRIEKFASGLIQKTESNPFPLL